MNRKTPLRLKIEKCILWTPSYSWYFKTSVIVLGVLILLFFTLNVVLKPYMRQINPELTPWLKSGNLDKVATE